MSKSKKKNISSRFKNKNKKKRDYKKFDSRSSRKILNKNRVNWESFRSLKNSRKLKKIKYKRRAKNGRRMPIKLIMVCLKRIKIGCKIMSHRVLRSLLHIHPLIKMVKGNKIMVKLINHLIKRKMVDKQIHKMDCQSYL